MPRVLVVCIFCLVLAASAAGETNWGAWVEAARKHHPLAGSIYVVARPTSWGYLGKLQTEVMAEGRLLRPVPPHGRGLVLPPEIVLLGEVHDNPAHHQVRAWLIENTARTDRPAVVLEQIRADQQAALDGFTALVEAGRGSADDLFRLLEWDKSGWPPEEIYRPLFGAVVGGKLPIYAGDPPRDRLRAVVRNGFSVVPPEERARLRLDDPMPAPLLDALRKELADSHCGVLTAGAIDGMIMAQRYRDAHLADALLAAAERHGSAILVAGNGHVRTDRGVPWYLLQRVPAPTLVLSYLLVEVEEGKTDPEAYLPRDPEGKPAANVLIFTPRAERGDPCEAMRKSKR